MKLSYKISAAFLTTFFLSLLLMILILRIHASISFSNFINTSLIEELSVLRADLASQFKSSGNWASFEKDPQLFREFVENHLPRKRFHDGPDDRPPHNKPPFDDRTPPNHFNPKGPMGDRLPPHDPLFMGGPRPMDPRDHFIDRISLFDANKHVVAGMSHEKDDNIFSEITLNGNVVGYIGLKKMEHLTEPHEIRFLNQQFRAFTLIGIGILLISILVCLVLSRRMLSPIKALADCTRKIASLKFDTRIQINSRDELGQLARDFNSMAMTLEKYETLRKQWITDVSHELRTPLSVLQAEIEAIEDGIRDMSGESIRSLHTEINHIIKIVNDLHDLSLADSGTLYFKTESIDPVLTLKNTLRLFKTQFDKAGITLVDETRTDGKTIVTADNDRLVQMFSNILENSLKYTLKPGKLTVRNSRSEEWVRLSMEDSGPGVPDEALPRLFDRLFRVDPSRNRISGGSGLGLSICRNITETLNGRISARNTGTGGLAIDIDLPLESRSTKRQP